MKHFNTENVDTKDLQARLTAASKLHNLTARKGSSRLSAANPDRESSLANVRPSQAVAGSLL